MFKFLLFSCLFICTVVNITTVAFSIQEFNTLVNFPMWKSLAKQSFCNILLTGHDLKGKLHSFNLQTLYSNDESYGTIITEDNFVDRVWQFHLLLSVYYAIELHPLLELALAHWNFCQDPETKAKRPFCTTSFFIKLRGLTKEIYRMHYSLLYFSEMLRSVFNNNQTLTNKIHTVLLILKSIVFSGPQSNLDVSNQLALALNHVKDFFATYVEPLTSEVKKGNTLVFSQFIDAIFHSRGRHQDETHAIEYQLATTIETLIQSNNGFGYLFSFRTLSSSVGLPSEDSWIPSFDSLSINKD